MATEKKQVAGRATPWDRGQTLDRAVRANGQDEQEVEEMKTQVLTTRPPPTDYNHS